MRSESEIRKQIGEADHIYVETDGGSMVPGMTYEEGVTAALRWVLGEEDELPIEPT